MSTISSRGLPASCERACASASASSTSAPVASGTGPTATGTPVPTSATTEGSALGSDTRRRCGGGAFPEASASRRTSAIAVMGAVRGTGAAATT
ncbi:MAG: hypothetical protein IPN17_38865 [Deltaproteobacteria bacterium]|nr:hypothetical protein [Deltaproteobacteria bacterium]